MRLVTCTMHVVVQQMEVSPWVLSAPHPTTGMLNWCENAQQWHQALGLLKPMQQAYVLPDVITYSAAIIRDTAACEEARQWHLALGLLVKMQTA